VIPLVLTPIASAMLWLHRDGIIELHGDGTMTELTSDPCPNCHDSECEGCISGYGASAAVLNAFERLERWRKRRGL
jgi:hypothetical protein